MCRLRLFSFGYEDDATHYYYDIVDGRTPRSPTRRKIAGLFAIAFSMTARALSEYWRTAEKTEARKRPPTQLGLKRLAFF